MANELLEAKIERLETARPSAATQGGRGDEPPRLALDGPGLWPAAGHAAPGRVASGRRPPSPPARRRSGADGTITTERVNHLGPRAALSWRGLPQAVGPAAFRRHPHQSTSRSAASPARMAWRPSNEPAALTARGPIDGRSSSAGRCHWGTDLTSVMTGEGQAAVFIAVDHCRPNASASRPATAPIASRRSSRSSRACASASAPSARGSPAGLALRHDHGSQDASHHFQTEIRFLGIESSPAFVREPEGNGCAGRLIRVLKENLLL